MGISSMHIQGAKSGSILHNARENFSHSVVFTDEKNECDHTTKEAYEIYRKELSTRSEAYSARTKQKLQKNALTQLSAIFNLKKHHTLKDLEPLKKYIENELDTKVYQIAIHRDEGKLVEKDTKKELYSGKEFFKNPDDDELYFDRKYTKKIDMEKYDIEKNIHAHIEMMGIDSTGAAIKRNKLSKYRLSQMQTRVANILQMERGQYNSKAKRRDTHDFKERGSEQQEQKMTVQSLKAEIERLRKELREKNKDLESKNKQKVYTLEDYQALNKLKKELKKDTLEEVYQAYLKLQKELHEKKTELAEKSKKKPLFEKIGLTSTKKDEEIEKLQKTNKKLRIKLKQAEAKIKGIEKQKPEIIQYIQNLKAKIESLEQQKPKEIEKIIEVPKVEYVENPVNIELKRKIRELEQELNKHKKENEISTKHSFQHLLFFKQYKALITTDLSSYFVKSQGEKTVFKSQKKRVEVVDNGDRLLAKNTNIQEQVKLMLDIAKAKKWNLKTLIINGSDQFKSEAKKQISERLEIAEQFALFDEFNELYSEPEEPESKEPEAKPEEPEEPEAKPKEPEAKPKEPEAKPKEPKPKPQQRTYMHP